MRLALYTVLLAGFGLCCYGIGHRAGARQDRVILNYATGFVAGRSSLLREIAVWDEVTAISVSQAPHRVL